MKIFLNIFFFLISFCACAQTVQVSAPFKLPSKTTKFRVIGQNNDGVVVRLYGTQDVINVFDESLKLVSTRTIDFKGQSGLMQYIMLNKSGAVIFYLTQDKKYSVLLAQPVNSKFIETGKPVVIDTIYDRKDLVASNLRFKPSVDQSYLMVYYPYFSGNTLSSIRFLTVDRSLHALYNKTVPMNRNEKEMEDSRSLIDNTGSVFFILHADKKTLGNTYDVFRISGSGDFSMYSILTEKTVFSDPYFDIDNKNGNLVMNGFYNDNSTGEDVANGFFYATYNPATGALVKTGSTPFSNDFIQELTGRPVKDKAKLYTFTIRKCILRNDGGSLILAESFIRDTREVPVQIGFQPGYANNNYRTTYIYQFNDILAFSVKPDGEMEWHAVMRKKQSSDDDNGVYSSFLSVNEKDRIRFLYLDDISTAGILNQYSLTSDGKTDRKAVLNQEDKDVMLLPKSGRQIAPNEAVIPSFLNGMLRLVKITY